MRIAHVLLPCLLAACGARTAPPGKAAPRKGSPAAASPAPTSPAPTSPAPATQSTDDDHSFGLYSEHADRVRAAQLSAAEAREADEYGYDSQDVGAWYRHLEAQDERLFRLETLDGMRDECGVPVSAAHRASALLTRLSGVEEKLGDLMGGPIGDALAEHAGEALRAVDAAEHEALEAREAVLRATVAEPCVVDLLLEAQRWHDVAVDCAADEDERNRHVRDDPWGDIDDLHECATTAAEVVLSLHFLPDESESLRLELALVDGVRVFGSNWEEQRAAALEVAGRCGSHELDMTVVPTYR